MPEIDYSTVGGYGPESLPGHSGSETSEAAARRPGIGPKTKEVHEFIKRVGVFGITCRGIEHATELGHGAASASLTRLHKAGLIVRLTERRGGQQVYVDADHVNGREESPYRPNAAYREDRKPMALERPEPTVESIEEDLKQLHTDSYAALMAPRILEIVRKYR